jgi:hypothetical protein
MDLLSVWTLLGSLPLGYVLGIVFGKNFSEFLTASLPDFLNFTSAVAFIFGVILGIGVWSSFYRDGFNVAFLCFHISFCLRGSSFSVGQLVLAIKYKPIPDAKPVSSSPVVEVPDIPVKNLLLIKIYDKKISGYVNDENIYYYLEYCEATYNDFISKHKEYPNRYPKTDLLEFCEVWADFFDLIYNDIPVELLSLSGGIKVNLVDLLQNPKRLVYNIRYDDRIKIWMNLSRAWTVVNENIDILDEGNSVTTREIAPWIKKFEGTARELVAHFLKNTIFEYYMLYEISIAIPEKVRTEHLHMLGGTGHGKTTALKYMIAKDIQAGHNVIVMDSQLVLIDTILKMDIPKERVVWISPRDVEYPLALNLFDLGIERINKFSKHERRLHINGLIELYRFIFSSLMDSKLTDTQELVFSYVTRLILQGGIPNATIHTMIEILGPNGLDDYSQYIPKLSKTAQTFFYQAYDTRQYNNTKAEISRRLFGLLQNEALEEILSATKSKIDIHREMNEEKGKVILIDTAEGFLKGDAKFFGSLFLSMISTAIQEREDISNPQRTYIYIDEAWQYFSDTFITILRLARKMNVGIIIAHQDFGGVPDDLTSVIMSNTSTKITGGISDKDARAMASNMQTSSDFIKSQNPYHFAMYIKGFTQSAISLRFENEYMENLPKRIDMADLKRMTREKYSVSNVSTEKSKSERKVKRIPFFSEKLPNTPNVIEMDAPIVVTENYTLPRETNKPRKPSKSNLVDDIFGGLDVQRSEKENSTGEKAREPSDAGKKDIPKTVETTKNDPGRGKWVPKIEPLKPRK